ncbi:ornithine cyclodeaminase [Sulfolobus sp. D5]|nr:ornithine cyclodeaminase [Sulfolobus sp. D5]
MTLLIKESEVTNLIDYREIYNSLVNAFELFENKLAINLQRSRISFKGATLTFQAAAMEDYIGYKTFISGNFLIFLYNISGELLSIIESDRLTQIRTAILSVIASDFIYGDYSSIGIIGLGKQGIAHVEVINEIKKGIKINVFTESKSRLEKAISVLGSEGISVNVSDSIKKICEDSEVIVSITKAKDPFIKLDYVSSKRKHINAMGSNIPEKIEVYPEVVKASKIIVVEDFIQTLQEAGELVIAKKMNMLDESKLVTLSSVISKKVTIPKEGITLFKSVGIGLEDLAVGKLIYEKALSKGIGNEIEVKGIWYRELERK